MFGTAGLPHVIVRFYTVKNVRAARYSAAWAILFIAILYTTAPALGMFARYNLINSLHEAQITAVTIQAHGEGPRTIDFATDADSARQAIRSAMEQNSKPKSNSDVEAVSIRYELAAKSGERLDWATRWQSTGLLVVEDVNQDGLIDLRLVDRSVDDSVVRRSELANLDRDIIVLSTPEVAGLPPWVIALVAAGGLAAALSTAAGLLLVISSSLAHDLYCRFVAPQASEAERVRIGRIAIVFGILVAGYFGIHPPGFVGEVVAFAFGLAAASFFPAIFLGIFSKNVNRAGAVSGMIVGLVFTMIYIVMCTADKVLPMFFQVPLLTKDQWLLGISPQGIGLVGMLLNFVVTLVVSAVTPRPPSAVLDLVESIRVPRGSGASTDH